MKIYLGGSFCGSRWRTIVRHNLSSIDSIEYVEPTPDDLVEKERDNTDVWIHGHSPGDFDIMQFVLLEKEAMVRMQNKVDRPRLLFLQFTYDQDVPNNIKSYVESVTEFGQYLFDLFGVLFIRVEAENDLLVLKNTIIKWS